MGKNNFKIILFIFFLLSKFTIFMPCFAMDTAYEKEVSQFQIPKYYFQAQQLIQKYQQNNNLQILTDFIDHLLATKSNEIHNNNDYIYYKLILKIINLFEKEISYNTLEQMGNDKKFYKSQFNLLQQKCNEYLNTADDCFFERKIHKAYNFFNLARLIENRVNVNRYDKYGRTPLHIFSAHRLLDHINLLVISGAEINKPSGMSETPLDWAIKHIPDHDRKGKALNLLRLWEAQTSNELQLPTFTQNEVKIFFSIFCNRLPNIDQNCMD